MNATSSPHAVDASGFVLAGGQSRRMGHDKALIELRGAPLIARAIATLRSAGLTASIVGEQSPLAGFAPVIHDHDASGRDPALGPLGGICAVLDSIDSDRADFPAHAVFLAVDQPFVPPSLLLFLLHHARITGRAVTLATVVSVDQTFPVVLRRDVLPHLRAELNAGRHGCLGAFSAAAAEFQQPVSRVSVEHLSQSGHAAHPAGLPAAWWLMNLNTPSAFRRACTLADLRIA
jgi:molybdenum cofactor guanylyltransferase